MDSILTLWNDNKNILLSKTVEQILSFCGDGKLKDGSLTSKEFRDFISVIPSELLYQYAVDCLTNTFTSGGFILQDLVNQIGNRLGFNVEYGLYRGTRKQDSIGYDGIWKSRDGHDIVVEVKTTDAYRINLDVVAEYRSRLIDEQKINKRKSSILIIVGRQDTGDLEAQIRGSKHAWDVRLISVDALLQLLKLRENLNDHKTFQQINEVLRPLEYTKVDQLINIIFRTTEDLQTLPDGDQDDKDVIDENIRLPLKSTRAKSAEFRENCLEKIQKHLRTNFIKQGSCLYSGISREHHLVCLVSKKYEMKNASRYWYAFHLPHQEFLAENQDSYIAFGCGTPEKVLLIPYKVFKTALQHLGKTVKDNNHSYWHVEIFEKNEVFTIRQNHAEDFVISEYLISG